MRTQRHRERGLDRLGLHDVRLLCHRLRGGGELLGEFAFTLLRLRELLPELLKLRLEALIIRGCQRLLDRSKQASILLL